MSPAAAPPRPPFSCCRARPRCCSSPATRRGRRPSPRGSSRASVRSASRSPWSTTPDATPTPEPDVFFLERVEPDEGSPDGGEIVRILGQEFESPGARHLRWPPGRRPERHLQHRSACARRATTAFRRLPPSAGCRSTSPSPSTSTRCVRRPTRWWPASPIRRGDVGVQPVIFSVTPNIGPNEGGTRITINGDGFADPVQVTFEQRHLRARSPGRVGVAHAAGGDLAAGGGLRQRPAQPAGGHPCQEPAQRPRGGARQRVPLRRSPSRSSRSIRPPVRSTAAPGSPSSAKASTSRWWSTSAIVRQQVLSVTGNEILVRTAAFASAAACTRRDAAGAGHASRDQPDGAGRQLHLPGRAVRVPTSSRRSPTRCRSPRGGDDQRHQLPASSSRSPSTAGRDRAPACTQHADRRHASRSIPEQRSRLRGRATTIGRQCFGWPALRDHAVRLVVTDLETGCSDTLSVNVRRTTPTLPQRRRADADADDRDRQRRRRSRPRPIRRCRRQ